MTSNDSILQILVARELELQQTERLSESRLSELLHIEFEEIGVSGRKYTREEIIPAIPSRAASAVSIESDEFTLANLGPDVALLTYRSALRHGDGTLSRHSLRSSLWVRSRTGLWQIRFHQGTTSATAW
ncbi:DUF4440 domain-containing protein [Ralstonia sp. 24A2]|uniref:nuclear transport factor 2 family protein n=1 Tax=Ralstonia sp. 24A2 TaxID=3447364 RepID=UPI003F6991EE